MAITNYHTVNREIIGETTSSVRTGYLTDGLGSVTATQGSTGNVLATYRYKPYGALLAKTGGGADPQFLWAGARAVRKNAGPLDLHSPPLRTLSASLGQWISRAGSWPRRKPYLYSSNPTSRLDPAVASATMYAAYLLPGIGIDIEQLNPCEGFYSTLYWDVSEFADWPGFGAVVQYVEATVDAFQCNGSGRQRLLKVAQYEGWQYENGKLVPPSVRDSDSYGSKTPIHCAVLKGSFFGTYAFLYPFNLNDWSFKWSNEYNVLVGSHHSKGTLRLNDAPAFRVTNFVSNCCKKTKTATLDDLYGWGSGWLFAFKSESVMGEDCKTC